MMKKVVFRLCSDVISCGINVDYNFLNSLDYIPGSVLRAGFAKDIYLGCDIEDRDNFIELKGNECDTCPNKNICEKFSEMSFSFMYKRGTIPSPLTAKKCKVKPNEHSIKDIILNNGPVVCEECKKINKNLGRMEDIKGYVNAEFKPDKIEKRTLTHTAINYAARTALSGKLYSTRSILRNQEFEAYIDDCGTGLVKVGATVYIGKYSSNGFGKLEIISVDDVQKTHTIKDRILEFTERYCSDKPEEKSDDRYYIPVLLNANARLGIEPSMTVASTEEYKKMWGESLFGENSLFEIEKVYAQNRLYSGYDTNTRNGWGKWKKTTKLETIAGSSFLVSVDKSKFDEAAEYLTELMKNGVGEDTLNGYGKIDVCSDIHMIGVNPN